MSRNLIFACLLIIGIVFSSCSKDNKAPVEQPRTSIQANCETISYTSSTYTNPSIARFSMWFTNPSNGQEYVLSADRVDTGFGFENGQISISETNLVATATSISYDPGFENTFGFKNIRTAKVSVTINDAATNDDAQGFKSIQASVQASTALVIQLTDLLNNGVDVAAPYKADKIKAAVFVDRLGKQLNDYSNANGIQPLPVHIRIEPR